MGGCPAASGVHDGTGGPHSDGDQISLLSPHPIHELAGEQAGDGVEDGKEGSDCSVVGVRLVELRLDEFLISERKHLAVKVVDRRGHEEKAANPPSPVGHQFFLC